MVTMNASDLGPAVVELLARVRRGESVVLLEDGRPVAQIGPPTPPEPAPVTAADEGDEDDEDGERWWRGTWAPALQKKPIPDFQLPTTPVELKRRPIEPNLSWGSDRDNDNE